MVLMKDIAEAVGVSNATVSLVLGGKSGSRVSESVKNRVLQTAKEMGYHSNDLARSLRTGRTNLISVIVTDISNDFFGKMSFYIQEEAKKYGYLVITANTNESDSELESIIHVLISKNVDGVIVVPTQNCKEMLEDVIKSGTPVVQIDRLIDTLKADYVGTDNYASSANAIKELITCGKKRIAMLTLKLDVNAITERVRGYEDALKNHNLYNPLLIRNVEFEEIHKVGEVMNDLLGQKPDAIFFSSRRVFTLAMDALSEHQHDGSSVTLLCFDEAKSYKALMSDSLWYVEQPIEDMAKKAFSLLMSKIQGTTTYSKHEYLSYLVK